MTDDAQTIEITKNADAGRFELRVDGQMVGLADFVDGDGVREFPHTEVDPALQGRGLAGRLVGTALQATREEGLAVDPVCPYVASFIRRHPEYQDLLA